MKPLLPYGLKMKYESKDEEKKTIGCIMKWPGSAVWWEGPGLFDKFSDP